MAVSGSGTQADPYVVETWDELVEKANTSNVYVKLGNNIDMNDEYPEGITTPLQVRCLSLDGDNKTIKNLAIQGNGMSYSWVLYIGTGTILKNIKFLNMNINRAIFIRGGYQGSTVKHCQFSGRFFQSCFHSINQNDSSYITFEYCSMNIDFNGSNFTYDIYTNNYIQSFSFCNLKVKNCYFHAALFNTYLTGENLRIKILNSEYSSAGQYSVIDADINSDGANISNVTGFLLNKDKVADLSTITLSSGNLVTTEQLTDAEYLASLGFPIQT